MVRWRCCIRGSNTLFHSEALKFFRHHCVLLPKVVLFDFCVKCVSFYFFLNIFLISEFSEVIKLAPGSLPPLPIPKDSAGVSCCAAECF